MNNNFFFKKIKKFILLKDVLNICRQTYTENRNDKIYIGRGAKLFQISGDSHLYINKYIKYIIN